MLLVQLQQVQGSLQWKSCKWWIDHQRVPYHLPTQDKFLFAKAVLSSMEASNLHVDIEMEPSFRMAQGTQCLHAIRNYMRKVKLKYQHVHPLTLQLINVCVTIVFVFSLLFRVQVISAEKSVIRLITYDSYKEPVEMQGGRTCGGTTKRY